MNNPYTEVADWPNLQTHYGPGEKLPSIIHALTIPDEFSSAIHQIYDLICLDELELEEASSYCVPLLFDLVYQNKEFNQYHLLRLLARIIRAESRNIEHEIACVESAFPFVSELVEKFEGFSEKSKCSALYLLSGLHFKIRQGLVIPQVPWPKDTAYRFFEKQLSMDLSELEQSCVILAIADGFEATLWQNSVLQHFGGKSELPIRYSVEVARHQHGLGDERTGTVLVEALDNEHEFLESLGGRDTPFGGLEFACPWISGSIEMTLLPMILYPAYLEQPVVLNWAVRQIASSDREDCPHLADLIIRAYLPRDIVNTSRNGLSESQTRILQALASNDELWNLDSGWLVDFPDYLSVEDGAEGRKMVEKILG